MAKPVLRYTMHTSGAGSDMLTDKNGEWVALDDFKQMITEVHHVLQALDNLAEIWGDEGVFRRCRDKLRALASDDQMRQLRENP